MLCFIVVAILRCNSFLMVQEYNSIRLLGCFLTPFLEFGGCLFRYLGCVTFLGEIEVSRVVSRCGFLAVSEK